MQRVSREEHYKMMTETPVRRLVIKLAIPTIISMLVSSIYNMADTFFVSQLGTSAAGAVGIVFSLMAIIQAIGFTIGMGAGNIASRKLGAKDDEEANRYASSGFFLGLVLSLLLLVFGTIFIDDLMRFLGATETILPYARDYARYILFGAPVMCLSFIMNNYLRAEGKAVYDIERVMKGSGKSFGDGTHILFISADLADRDTDLGRLMEDLRCPDPERMHYRELRDRVSYFKETKEGITDMENEFDRVLKNVRKGACKILCVIGKCYCNKGKAGDDQEKHKGKGCNRSDSRPAGPARDDAG